MVALIVLEISPRSVRESVEREISTDETSGTDSLQVLRALRTSGELRPFASAQLHHLEHGRDQSAKLLFQTIQISLESRQPTLTHECLKCGLCKHEDRTLDSLADLLFKDDAPSRAEVRRRLRVGGAEKDSAVAELSSKFLEFSGDAKILTEVTRILTQDKKNSALREAYETAVEYMRQLKESATRLLRQIVQSHRGGEVPSIADTFGHHSSSKPLDTGGAFELKSSESSEHSKRGHRPEEEAARAIKHFADDKRASELRSKFEKKIDEMLRHNAIAVAGPAELREAAAIARNQDQVEAGKIASELKDVERSQDMFDA